MSDEELRRGIQKSLHDAMKQNGWLSIRSASPEFARLIIRLMITVKVRDDRIVAELQKQKREDTDTWRSWNQAIDTAIKVIRNMK